MSGTIQSNVATAEAHVSAISLSERVKVVSPEPIDTTKVEGGINTSEGRLRKTMNTALDELALDMKNMRNIAQMLDAVDESNANAIKQGGDSQPVTAPKPENKSGQKLPTNNKDGSAGSGSSKKSNGSKSSGSSSSKKSGSSKSSSSSSSNKSSTSSIPTVGQCSEPAGTSGGG